MDMRCYRSQWVGLEGREVAKCRGISQGMDTFPFVGLPAGEAFSLHSPNQGHGPSKVPGPKPEANLPAGEAQVPSGCGTSRQGSLISCFYGVSTCAKVEKKHKHSIRRDVRAERSNTLNAALPGRAGPRRPAQGWL